MTKQELKKLTKWEQEYKAKRQTLGLTYFSSLSESQIVELSLNNYRRYYR
jgi:hypothetical protein